MSKNIDHKYTRSGQKRVIHMLQLSINFEAFLLNSGVFFGQDEKRLVEYLQNLWNKEDFPAH